MGQRNILTIFVLILFSAVTEPVIAQWEYGGKIICGNSWPTYDQFSHSDGEGGILLAWEDYREQYNPDIYVQKIDSAGYTVWQENGVQAVVNSVGQYYPLIVPNADGGAIVGWTDFGRQSPYFYRVYAQHVDGDGNLVWPDSGLAVIDSGGHRWLCFMVSDGYGGAIMLCDNPVAAQRVDDEGNLLFTGNGLRMTEGLYSQVYCWLTATTDSNFIAVWFDGRDIEPGPGIYAQKFSLYGEILWEGDGMPLAIAPVYAYYDRFEISPAPGGGVFAFWENGPGAPGVWMQWVDGQGQARWGPNGMVISDDFWDTDPKIATNWDGRAIIAWNDEGNNECFLNIIDTTGARHWEEDVMLGSFNKIYGLTQAVPGEFEIGVEDIYLDCRDRVLKYDMDSNFVWGDTGVCFACYSCPVYKPRMISDGVGGAFLSWKRNEDVAVMLNRVYPDGWVAPRDTPVLEDEVSIPERSIAIHSYPNPFNSHTAITYSGLGSGAIEIFNIAGQRIRTFEITSAEGRIIWDARDALGNKVSSGIYFARAKAANAYSTSKLMYLR